MRWKHRNTISFNFEPHFIVMCCTIYPSHKKQKTNAKGCKSFSFVSSLSIVWSNFFQSFISKDLTVLVFCLSIETEFNPKAQMITSSKIKDANQSSSRTITAVLQHNPYCTSVFNSSGTMLFIGSLMSSPSLSTPVARSCNQKQHACYKMNLV